MDYHHQSVGCAHSELAVRSRIDRLPWIRKPATRQGETSEVGFGVEQVLYEIYTFHTETQMGVLRPSHSGIRHSFPSLAGKTGRRRQTILFWDICLRTLVRTHLQRNLRQLFLSDELQRTSLQSVRRYDAPVLRVVEREHLQQYG